MVITALPAPTPTATLRGGAANARAIWPDVAETETCCDVTLVRAIMLPDVTVAQTGPLTSLAISRPEVADRWSGPVRPDTVTEAAPA